MNSMAILPRALGSLFFYSPHSEINQSIRPEFLNLVLGQEWQDERAVRDCLAQMTTHFDSLERHTFSVLFEGQGEMSAPPWGSVYQNRENLVMGDSTAAFSCFLDRIGLEFDVGSQPMDHFAIMLWSLAYLVEENQVEPVRELLELHLLPWAYRYLELLELNAGHVFYSQLAIFARLYLQELERQMALQPATVRLYK